jgi:hypothetical protein
MREHADKIKSENDKLKEQHNKLMAELQKAHDQKIAGLQRQ